MLDRVLMVVGVALAWAVVEVIHWAAVKRKQEPPKPERPTIRITYRWTPPAKGRDSVPRYEAGTDVAGAVQRPAHDARRVS